MKKAKKAAAAKKKVAKKRRISRMAMGTAAAPPTITMRTFLAGPQSKEDRAYLQLIACLSRIRGWPVSRIKEGTELEGDMGYDYGARGALAAELNLCFQRAQLPLNPPLQYAETAGCATVGDLADLVEPRV